MILSNTHILGREGVFHIRIKGSKIFSILEKESEIPKDETVMDVEGALAFPGLINSHDHLDFNSFPQLGNRIYNNYTEWGKDIHHQNKKEMDEVLKIPLHLRIQQGIYKNLLSGVTTVVNHGSKLEIENPSVHVFQDCVSLHSPSFEKNWKWKLNFLRRKWPAVMHVGEGTDEQSANEISRVIKWNFFKREIIAVHGVAMNAKQAKHFKALVWCPASNYFLLNKTANMRGLKKETEILFGTDSTLTAPGNIWDHLRLARKEKQLTDQELLDAVTKKAAAIWRLNTGEIAMGKDADIVIAKKSNDWDSFFKIEPEDILLVTKNGKIRMLDKTLAEKWKTEINFEDCSLYQTKFIADNFTALLDEIKQYTEPNISF